MSEYIGTEYLTGWDTNKGFMPVTYFENKTGDLVSWACRFTYFKFKDQEYLFQARCKKDNSNLFYLSGNKYYTPLGTAMSYSENMDVVRAYPFVYAYIGVGSNNIKSIPYNIISDNLIGISNFSKWTEDDLKPSWSYPLLTQAYFFNGYNPHLPINFNQALKQYPNAYLVNIVCNLKTGNGGIIAYNTDGTWYGGSTSNRQYDVWDGKITKWGCAFYDDKIPNSDLQPPDPYEPVAPTPPEFGGGGSFETPTDPIPLPDLPLLGSLNAGFINVWNPTFGELANLAKYLWSNDITQTWYKLIADPMDCLMSLSLLPVKVKSTTRGNIYVGNVNTGIELARVDDQYVLVDCGEIDIKPYYGSYLDYSPYTRMIVQLPYIGAQELDPDEFVGKKMSIKYYVDILSGNCVAFILSDNNVLYQYTGNCLTQIPISSLDMRTFISNALNIGLALVGGVGGAINTATSVSSGEVSGINAKGDNYNSSFNRDTNSSTITNASQHTFTGLASTANAVLAGKPKINHSGSLSASAGLMGLQKPYITFIIPNYAHNAEQKSLEGYPSFSTIKLSETKGFIKVRNCNLEISGTNEEKDLLVDYLTGGVIIK